MIAAVEWIPAGRADPSPRKYESSRAERDFLARVRAGDLARGEEEDGDDGDANAKEEAPPSDDEEWEDVAEEDEDAEEEEEGGGSKKSEPLLPKVDPASLPADLRMDEYSDDDGGDYRDADVGGLLVGKDAEMTMGVPFEGRGKRGGDDDDDDSSDSEDEDDLADVPDTREYMPLDVEGLRSLGIGGGGGNNFASPEGDGGGYTAEDLRNMTLNDADLLDDVYDDDDDEEDDDDDADDVRIRDGDALLVVAKAEEDFASLEVHVFDAESSNLYVHHDVPLPSFPLCLALGTVAPSYDANGGAGAAASSGNYVAVGSFEPGIEVWNLDVTNPLEPTVVLGGADTRGAEEDWMRTQLPTSATVGGGGSGKNRKKKKKKPPSRPGLREGSHADAVMGLSWNAIHRQVLASGSADGTVKLWDVTHQGSSSGGAGDYARPSATLTHHDDKVPSLAWHPSEGTLLATGGYDRRVCLVDARSAVAASGGRTSAKRAKLSADCEALAWDPHSPQYLTAASEDGVVRCWDVRKFESDPVWSVVAHEFGGVSDLCYNARVPGMLATCSVDKTVALWDTRNVGDGGDGAPPRPCGAKDMNVGRLHAVSCHPSAPWLLACGGGGNELAVWDMEGEDAIRRRFADRGGGEGDGAVDGAPDDGREPDFEAVMASGDGEATRKALEGMSKSKKKKKGKKKGKAHKGKR